MEICNLLQTLERLQRLYEVGGAKSAQSDLTNIIECLRQYSHEQISDLLARIPSSASSRRRVGGAPTAKLSGATLVEAHLNRLREAGVDKALFTEAFALLSTDKTVKKPELDQIARAFVGQIGSFRTKKAALNAIEEKFVERARFQNQLTAVAPRDR